MIEFESSPHVPSSSGSPRASFADGFGFEAHVFDKDGATVVVVGEIDMATAGLFQEAIAEACAGSPHVVIDLAGTTFIDSCGVAVVLRAHGELGRRPGAVRVRAAAPRVTRTFEVSGLRHLIAS